MYDIKPSTNFQRKYRKLTAKDKILKIKVIRSVKKLREDPMQKSLKTHKVKTAKHGEVYSSYISGDIRLLWQQEGKTLVLILVDIGGHEGSRGIY